MQPCKNVSPGRYPSPEKRPYASQPYPYSGISQLNRAHMANFSPYPSSYPSPNPPLHSSSYPSTYPPLQTSRFPGGYQSSVGMSYASQPYFHSAISATSPQPSPTVKPLQQPKGAHVTNIDCSSKTNSVSLDMAGDKRIGEIESVSSETKHIEWRILEDIFSPHFDEDYIAMSPTFTFKDTTYYLRLTILKDDEAIYIDIYTDEPGDFIVEYCFGLKKCDGTMKDVIIGTVRKGESCSDKGKTLILKSKLLKQKTEYAPSNILTVSCTLKTLPEVPHFTAPTTKFEEAKSLKLTKLDKLSKNFRDLFADQESCDVIFKVKEKEYKAHKSVLIARSSVFAANFKHDTLERQTGIITIPDCDSDSFREFLEYLYCGELEKLTFPNAFNLYYTSDKYNVVELKTFCVECILQCITVETMCEIAVLANEFDETELLSAVQDFFNQNVCKILESPEWECLLKKDYRLANKLMINMSKVKLEAGM